MIDSARGAYIFREYFDTYRSYNPHRIIRTNWSTRTRSLSPFPHFSGPILTLYYYYTHTASRRTIKMCIYRSRVSIRYFAPNKTTTTKSSAKANTLVKMARARVCIVRASRADNARGPVGLCATTEAQTDDDNNIVRRCRRLHSVSVRLVSRQIINSVLSSLFIILYLRYCWCVVVFVKKKKINNNNIVIRPRRVAYV